VPAGQVGTLLLPPRWGYSSPFTSPLTGAGTLNVTVDFIRDYFNGDWSDFTGQINVSARSGSGDFRINNPNGYAGSAIYLGAGVRFGCIYNSTQTIDISELAGAAGSTFGTCDSAAGTQTWRVGGRQTSATYAGTIVDGAHAANVVKIGNGTWTLTGANTYTGTTTISGGTLQLGAGGTSGSLASATILNDATLAFNRSDDLTYAGAISGAGSLIKLGAGALTLSSPNTYTGLTRVSAGQLVLTDIGLPTGSAGYALSGGAVLDGSLLPAGLLLGNGQTLSGSGSILGSVTAGDGATVSPGDSIGVLTFGGALSLFPLTTIVMEVSRLPLTNDQVIAQSLACGGSLVVSRSGTVPFTGGEVFRLFSAGSITGGFANVSLPALGPGLVWNTSRLYVDGTLAIASTNPPRIGGVSLVGTNLVLSGSGGSPGAIYYVLRGPDLTLSSAQWTRVATNSFDGAGGFVFSDPVDVGAPQVFYQLQVP
jgi:fibronectin-binding autotransporter adhesin